MSGKLTGNLLLLLILLTGCGGEGPNEELTYVELVRCGIRALGSS